MKKIIVTLVSLAVLLVMFFTLNYYIYNEKQATGFTPGETVAVVGTVLAIDMTQAAYDGPMLITLQPKEGTPVTVAVPSMGLPLCAAYQAKNIGDVSLMKVGQELKVRGIVGENGAIVPCEQADHYLGPTPLIVEDFEGEADPSRMTLTMKTWAWVSSLYNDGKKVTPKTPGTFTLTFTDKGTFSATTDCNSMGGSYTLGANNSITFKDIFSTKMYCEGSQEGDFAGYLSNTASYHFTSRGELIFDLKFDSGTVSFR